MKFGRLVITELHPHCQHPLSQSHRLFEFAWRDLRSPTIPLNISILSLTPDSWSRKFHSHLFVCVGRIDHIRLIIYVFLGSLLPAVQPGHAWGARMWLLLGRFYRLPIGVICRVYRAAGWCKSIYFPWFVEQRIIIFNYIPNPGCLDTLL